MSFAASVSSSLNPKPATAELGEGGAVRPGSFRNKAATQLFDP